MRNSYRIPRVHKSKVPEPVRAAAPQRFVGDPKGGGLARPAETAAGVTMRLVVIFVAMVVCNLIINLDGGGVPAALTNIQRTFDLEAWALGLLGALVYVGQAVGCVVSGMVLKRYSPTHVCRAALVTNTLMTSLFAASSSTAMLLVARFLIGFLQAAPIVYFPVWVDEYGPPKVRTQWMALVQAGAPLGSARSVALEHGDVARSQSARSGVVPCSVCLRAQPLVRTAAGALNRWCARLHARACAHSHDRLCLRGHDDRRRV